VDSTVSNKLMFDAGFSSHQDRRRRSTSPASFNRTSPGLVPERQSHGPLARHANQRGAERELHVATRRYVAGTMTYVTGSHNIKAGVQQDWDRRGLRTTRTATSASSIRTAFQCP